MWIKWKRLRKPKQETVKAKIQELRSGITWRRKEVARLTKMLN